MKSNLNDQHTRRPADEEIVARPQKAPYSSPVLQVYGSVGKLTQGAGSHNGDGGNKMPAPSDRRTKENIVRAGDHPLGIGLYLFDYRPQYREQWGAGRQFGVMADEVETVMPEAICVHPDGYKMVNYAMLGMHRSVQ